MSIFCQPQRSHLALLCTSIVDTQQDRLVPLVDLNCSMMVGSGCWTIAILRVNLVDLNSFIFVNVGHHEKGWLKLCGKMVRIKCCVLRSSLTIK
jgi:hypothetical protein